MEDKSTYVKFCLRLKSSDLKTIEDCLMRGKFGVSKSEWIRQAIQEKFDTCNNLKIYNNNMIPYDGFGYGQSTYWSYAAKIAAKENGEYCKCWDTHLPQVQLDCSDGIGIKIKCVSEKEFCKSTFTKTQQEIKEKFERFYSDK